MKPLTIAEAIKKLQEYPGEWLFLTDAYETEYDNPWIQPQCVIKRTRNHKDYNGDYVRVPGASNAVIVKRALRDSTRL